MDAIVFMIDSTNKNPYDDTKEYLDDLINEGREGVPLLVMANNQEDPNAKSNEVITEQLGLARITNRKWSK